MKKLFLFVALVLCAVSQSWADYVWSPVKTREDITDDSKIMLVLEDKSGAKYILNTAKPINGGRISPILEIPTTLDESYYFTAQAARYDTLLYLWTRISSSYFILQNVEKGTSGITLASWSSSTHTNGKTENSTWWMFESCDDKGHFFVRNSWYNWSSLKKSNYNTLTFIGGTTAPYWYNTKYNNDNPSYTYKPVNQWQEGLTIEEATDGINVAAAFTVYKWVEAYPATFHLGSHGTIDNMRTNKVITAATVDLPIPTPDPGYVFVGWNTKEDGTGTNISRIADYVNITANIDYYAMYEPVYTAYQIPEWYSSAIVLSSTAAIDAISVQVLGNATSQNISYAQYLSKQQYTLSQCKLSGDAGVYTIPVNQSEMMAHQGEALKLEFIDASGDVMGSAYVDIPIIIASAKDASTLSVANKDVFVVNGGVLTIDESCTIKNLHIQGGAKVVVPNSTTLTISEQLTMQGGAIENGAYFFRYPQLVMNGAISLPSPGTIYYDYLIDASQYYALTLPFNVDIANIAYYNGAAMTRGDGTNSTYDYKIQYYDGAARAANGATGGTGWEVLDGSATTLTAGHGYTIFAKPQVVRISGGSSQRQKYACVRFPMAVGTNMVAETVKSVNVTAHPVAGTNVNDAGWNLIGNPYFANYKTLTLAEEGEIGLLVDNGDGYEWSGTQRYVVIPSSDGQSYSQSLAANATLPAFKNFFVQVASTGQLTFTLANRAQSIAARRLMAETEPAKETMTGLTINGCSMADNMGVLIGEQFTDAYEINADLDKWTNNGLNIYALSGTSRLAFIAIPEASAENIPVGIATTVAGNYTIALDPTYDLSDITALFLFDVQTQKTTNLLTDSYSFSTSAGRVENRFVLNVTMRQNTTTDTQRINGAHGLNAEYYDMLGRYMGRSVQQLPNGVYMQYSGDESKKIVVNNR